MHPDWNRATSFEQYVCSLFRDQKFHTEEFKILLRLKGREHIAKIYERWKSGVVTLPDPSHAQADSGPAEEPLRDGKASEPSHGSRPQGVWAGEKAKSFVERSCPDDDLRLDEGEGG